MNSRVLAFLLSAICFLLSDVPAQIMSPRAASQIQPKILSPQSIVLSPQPVVDSGLRTPDVGLTVPVGETIPLVWDNPPLPFAGITIYASSNKLSPTWRMVGQTFDPAFNSLTVSNIFLPQWFTARAYAGTDESTNSNIAGVLGWQNVLEVTNHNYSSTNNATWTEIASQRVFIATNAPGQQFFRSKMEIGVRHERVVE